MNNPSLLCLQWGNHKTALTCRLSNLRKEGVFCDATIACAEKFFPVHRIVLSSCSEYFEEIFKRTPCKHPFIILKDIEVSSIEYILDFIYKGDVKISENKLPSFLKTAENLKIKGLAVPDVPVSGRINDDVSCDTESEDNDESYLSTGENDESKLSVTEPISAVPLHEEKCDVATTFKAIKKSPVCHINNEEQISDIRGRLRSGKVSRIVGESQSLAEKRKSSEETKSRKKSPVKVKVSMNTPDSEKENDKSKSLTNLIGVKKTRSKMGERANSKSAGQEPLNLRECTLTFTGKQEAEEEDTGSVTEWVPPKLKGNITQQQPTAEKTPSDSVVENISEAQMKVDVDEFFDDPNDGSRLVFTDDIVPLQYQIPDVHIGMCMDSSDTRIQGSPSPSPSHEDTDEISPSPNENVVAQVSDSGSEATHTANNAERAEGLPISLIGLVKNKPVDEEKPFACYICPYRTKYRSSLIKHVLVHTGAKPFKCTYCSYESSRKTHLKQHLMTHMEVKPYKCEVCSKSFTQKSSYKAHSLVHSQRKPFRCHLCPYATNNSASLRRHIRIHEGTIPFRCHLCSFGAQASGDLKKHFRTHTGEKPFPCPHCDYKAAVKTTLKRHMAARHKISL